MSSTIFLENIKNYLLRYAQQLESSNKTGIGGPSVLAEGVFMRIFNIIFGWELINSNSLASNQRAFDLVELERNIYIQITANKSFKKKFDDSLSMMKDIAIEGESKFIVFFITKDIQKDLLKSKKINDLTYSGADLSWLFHEMQYRCDANQLGQINNLLQNELNPVTISYVDSTEIETHRFAQELVLKNVSFHIDRESLVQELFDFSQNGNGLLTGGPGFGKSFLIDALQRDYYKKEIPCYVIRINELIDGDDAEISKLLGFEDRWLEHLLAIRTENINVKALLVIDALDTAKDERLKSRIHKHLRTIMKKLVPYWNIVIGCRTYDASKSIILQELFPEIVHKTGNNSRYMEIPLLDESELENVLSAYPEMSRSVVDCTPDLYTLLKVPYFLGLLKQIVTSVEHDAVNLSGITTESQLLGVFWKAKVESKRSLDLFAHKLTSALAAMPSLIAETYDVVTSDHTEDFEELVRQHIIIEHQGHRKHISFAHNILLEYTISRYLLYDKVDKQIDFIKENEKLPFLFRQSFVYFYNDLWDNHRSLFWEHYFQIGDIKEPIFRLFHQTVLNFIVIVSYRSPDEILPLLNESESDSQVRGESLRKALESLRFIHKGNVRERDVDFLALLCRHLHPILLWEIGLHLETAISYYSCGSDKENMRKLAIASREYMQYGLKERLTFSNRSFIDQNFGYRGIKNLCATFDLDPAGAKQILKCVLELLNEEDFPLNFFSTLTDCIVEVFKADSEFAVQIYKTIYFHNENSDKSTSFGGAVLALNSNRRQDFQSNYYALEQKYKELLKINFLIAMRLGAYIVNRVNEARSYDPDLKKLPVKVGKVSGFMFTDHSSFEEDEQHGPFTHGKLIFEVLENFTVEGVSKEKLLGKLYEITGVIEASSLWRKLLYYLKNNTNDFADFAYEVLCNKIFFESDETLYEAVRLLEILWPILDSDRRKNIEELIFKLDNPQLFYPDPSWLERRIETILSGISHLGLELKQTKDFLKKHGTRENKRIVSSGLTVAENRMLTPEERMAQSGFYTENGQKEIYNLFSIIETFNSSFTKQTDDEKVKLSFKSSFKAARQLFEITSKKSFDNDRMKFSCDYELAKFVNILSAESAKLTLNERLFVKKTARHYIAIDDYKKNRYESGDLGSRFGSAFSPSARTASVQPLMNTMYDDKDPETESLVLNLMNDNAAIIRLKSLSALTYFWYNHKTLFWEKIFERLAVECDGLCMNSLIRQLCFDNIIKDNCESIDKASLLIAKRLIAEDSETRREIWKTFVTLQLIRILRYDRQNAMNVVRQNFAVREFCRCLTFEIRTSLNLFNGDSDFIGRLEKASVFFDILKEILVYRFESAKFLGLSDSRIHNDLEIVDHVIQNIYFAINHEDNNDARKLSNLERKALFAKFLPLLYYTAQESTEIENGFMVAHTGYYFMQILNLLVNIEPGDALELSTTVIVCAAKNGFTYDSSTLREVVTLAERLIVDHKKLLSVPENFSRLITILDQFAQSGSQEALQLTWSLKDSF